MPEMRESVSEACDYGSRLFQPGLPVRVSPALVCSEPVPCGRRGTAILALWPTSESRIRSAALPRIAPKSRLKCKLLPTHKRPFNSVGTVPHLAKLERQALCHLRLIREIRTDRQPLEIASSDAVLFWTLSSRHRSELTRGVTT